MSRRAWLALWLGLPLLGLVGLVLLLATAPGLRLLWAGLRPVLPAEMQVSGVSGRLLGALRLEGVRYTTATLAVRIESLDLMWHPAALLRGDLDVEHLELAGVAVTRLAEDETPIVLPPRIDLPVAVSVRRLSVGPIRYRTDPEAAPLVVDAVTASLRQVSGALTVTGLQARAPQGSARGELRLQTSGVYPLSGGLDLDLAVDGLARAHARLELGGDLQRLSVGLDVGAPYAIAATATVDDPLNTLGYELRVDVREGRLAAIVPGWPALSMTGWVHARGDLEHSDLEGWTRTTIEGVGPVEARLEGARLGAGRLRIDRLAVEVVDAPGRLDLSGELGLSGPQPRIQGRIDWQNLQWPVRGTPALSSRQGRARIHGPLVRPTATLDLALGPRGRVDGEVRVGEAGRMTLEASWRDLVWPEQAPRVESPEGRLHLAGLPDGYTLNAEAQLRHGPEWGGRLSLSGAGDRSGVRLQGLDLRTAQGRIGGQGTVAWDPALSLQAELRGEDLDPQALAPDWPGRVDIELEAGASRRGGRWAGTLGRLELVGELHGYPVKGTAKGRLDRAGALDGEFALNSGDSTIGLEGRVDAREVDLRWHIDSPDLDALWPGAGGGLHGRGRVQGPRATPRVEASLAGSAVQLAGYGVKRLELEADVDLSDRRSSAIRLDARAVSEPRLRLDELALEATGRMTAHRISVEADAPQGALNLDVEGVLSEAAWRFRLTRGRIAPRDLRPWVLEGPAAGRIGRDGQMLELGRSCWRSEPARLCLEGRRDTQGEHGAVALTDLSLKALSPWLPAHTELKGAVSAHARLERPAGESLQLEVDVHTTAGQVLPVSLHGHPEAALHLAPGRGRLRLDAKGLGFRLKLPLEPRGAIDIELEAPAAGTALEAWPLRGTVHVAVGDLGFVSALVPEIQAFRGEVEGTIHVAGTVGHPLLSGQLALDASEVALATPGIHLKGVRLVLEGKGRDVLGVKGQAASGGGSLSLEGVLRFTGGGVQTHLKVRGERFQVADLYEAQVYVSPKLQIDIRDRDVRVRGDILVPEARIRLRELPATAVTVSGDEVIVGPAAAVPEGGERYRVDAQIRLVLGKKVSFEGFGLKADLAGSLMLQEQPGKETAATGDIEVRNGRYKAYGQDLDIKEGRLLFAGGDVSNPGLYVRAVRRGLSDMEVGVKVTGSLRRPKIDLFSDPDMSQQEQLSYLLFGHAPTAKTSEEEQKGLDQAALALGLGAGGALLGDLGQGLGLDEVGVASQGEGTSKQAALVVGKYLSPKLYVSYGMGLFEPISTLRLRYTLSSRWKLVTESSAAGSGIDIYYTIEH